MFGSLAHVDYLVVVYFESIGTKLRWNADEPFVRNTVTNHLSARNRPAESHLA